MYHPWKLVLDSEKLLTDMNGYLLLGKFESYNRRGSNIISRIYYTVYKSKDGKYYIYKSTKNGVPYKINPYSYYARINNSRLNCALSFIEGSSTTNFKYVKTINLDFDPEDSNIKAGVNNNPVSKKSILNRKIKLKYRRIDTIESMLREARNQLEDLKWELDKL